MALANFRQNCIVSAQYEMHVTNVSSSLTCYQDLTFNDGKVCDIRAVDNTT